MTKELRRLSVIVLAMFLALFVSTTLIQGVHADSLAHDSRNDRTKYDSYEVRRGSIIVDGTAIAQSVPSGDLYAYQRKYTDPEMWAPVTGYLPVEGVPTGIEKAMDGELSGQGDSEFFARLEQLVSGQNPRGASVELSLDADVQRAAFEALGDQQGAVVAIEPATGRILAMVSTPGFDANAIASHSFDEANSAYDSYVEDEAKPLYNRAISGDMNPPGSTFKLVVATAALESGEYTADSKLPNPDRFILPGTTTPVFNASNSTCGPGKTVTIADALRLSCNVPMAELAIELGDDAIRATAEKFGFNHSFTLPLEAAPSVYPDTLDDAQTGTTGFGQGDVRATPLQMAMVSAAIANGGVAMNPTMVDDVLAPNFSVRDVTAPSEFGTVMSPETAEAMQQMMLDNVSNGVASGATIDGVDVGGKTGTAENGESRPYSLWFTGFAPAADPQVAVAVVVENGGGMGQSGSGGEIAAPIAKQVMEAVLNK